MKRSEMLEILEDVISNSYDYATDTGSTYDYDSILSELENAGMLPPLLDDLIGYLPERLNYYKWELEDD